MRTVTFLPSVAHCQELGYSVRTYTISFLSLHTCIYHIPISVCYFQRILIFHLLSFFLNACYSTSRSHMGRPNMMYRVLLHQDFERTELCEL
jgi:hypothetical protein